MKSNFFKISSAVLISITIIVTFLYTRFYEYYNYNESDTFQVTVGDTFQIKLRENSSTGYINCWINQNQATGVTLVNEATHNSLSGLFGASGAGEIKTLTFKASQKGNYTIKIAKCPALREKKPCSEYSEATSSVENEFFVTVIN
ncbi:protease inhibitor I42 family protein [Flavobacterium sp. J27]|uniref:protease inhibitor I42 family protein n=1 Tax=Flavobacterium sp. J27 TaxID=2060419 RepID=UPI00102F9CA2|nr:protease inhibitor I42 family protein [Flavobacterium sp. J27]